MSITQTTSQVSSFVPAGSPTVSLPTGMNGLGAVMNLPAVDTGNVQLQIVNKGEHPVQVNIGTSSPVNYAYSPPASLRVHGNKSVLLTGLDAAAAATATQVSIASSGPGCVMTFQRGSLTTSQAAA